MASRKELDLNQLPSDDEQPFQEKFPQTETIIDIHLDETCTEMKYANHIAPTKVKVEWNMNYPHQAFQTFTYVKALEAGPSNPTKVVGIARTLRTKKSITLNNNKIRRGSSSRDPKSPVKIAPKPPAMPLIHTQPFYQQQQLYAPPLQRQKLYAQPFQLQQFYSQPFQQQQVDAQPFRLKLLYAQPFLLQQLHAELIQIQVDAQPLQQQKFYAQPFQPQQLYAQPFQPQQLYALVRQKQQLNAQPVQLQQLSAQTFQQQQQHPSSSAAKAEPADSRDHGFGNIKQIGYIEHPQPEGIISTSCRPYCPYLHNKSSRLENHDIFEFSKKKDKSKKKIN